MSKIELRFDKRFEDFIREHGSEARAKTFATKWFEEQTKKPRVNTSADFALHSGRLEAGKIYIFNYDPKTKDILSFYDKHPIILALGPSKRVEGLDLGININFLPPKYKRFLLGKIFDYSRSKIRKALSDREKIANTGKTPRPNRDEAPLRIYYDIAKRLIPDELAFAIRSYYMGRRTDTFVLTYEKWTDITMISIEDIEKVSLGFIYRLWKSRKK